MLTQRLILRQWRDSDFEPFAQLNADPRVMEYFPDVLDRQKSDAVGSRLRGLIAERGWGLWAVELLETQEFIGFVGLGAPLFDQPFCPCVEIGWRLAYDFWGKGYATEAAGAALQFGFETIALDEIVSFAVIQNQRSRAVMTKIGMRRDDYEFDHPNVPAGRAFSRHCLYRLTRADYEAAQISASNTRSA